MKENSRHQVNISVWVEECPELRDAIENLAHDFQFSSLRTSMLHDAVETGAFIQEIQSGRAEIKYM